MKRTIIAAALSTIALACAAQPAPPPTPVANPLVAEARASYARIKVNITKAADAMPDENYSFSPTTGQLTFLQVVAHVADAQTGLCSSVTGERKTGDAKDAKTKTEVIAKLKASFELCDATFNATTDAVATDTSKGRSKLSSLWNTFAHDQEQYAIMSSYMRAKGVKPPTAQN